MKVVMKEYSIVSQKFVKSLGEKDVCIEVDTGILSKYLQPRIVRHIGPNALVIGQLRKLALGIVKVIFIDFNNLIVGTCSAPAGYTLSLEVRKGMSPKPSIIYDFGYH